MVSDSFKINMDKRSEVMFDFKSLVPQHTLDCYHVQIKLNGTQSFANIILTNPGCSGKSQIVVGDTSIDGYNTDLSSLSIESHQWHNFSIHTENKQFEMKLNGTSVLNFPYPKDIGELLVMRVEFLGTGIVKSFKLKGDKEKHNFEY